MNIMMNGEVRDVPEGLTILGLLEHVDMAGGRVAVERNRMIVPRAQWNETTVQPNDTFEIVHFVGGG